MNTSTAMPRQPDIEIYLKDASAEQIKDWLEHIFGNLIWAEVQLQSFSRAAVQFKDTPINILIYPGAAGKKYTSILFESDQTPWQTDLECAESAVKHTGLEARCSVSGWQEDEPEDDGFWWKVTSQGASKVRWQ